MSARDGHLGRRRFGRLLSSGGLGLALGACGRSSSGAGTLTVLAAASLTDAFTELASDFQAAQGVAVVLSTAGSQALRVQIEQGAPADLFASANARHMEALVEAGWVRDAEVFATGELVLVVPRGNPAGLRTLEDLPRAERVVLGTPEVPIGSYARTVLDRAEALYGPGFRSRVEARVVSLEPNVRLVLTKVELGEADAALVYRSDATSARAVEVVSLPELGVRPEYHVGVLTAAAAPGLAERFVALLRGEAGQAVLRRHGFGSPA
ncbi:MAG: molybdate ABC transporter substrate-binding protein [Myxococcales bacterium]|nr:molybdate ABC transporter substrate-binding protein [Myxococcales bacterium]MCB9712907.1 molybdate ABC transporter substrate-binding protein [Myxococcales bacterium]